MARERPKPGRLPRNSGGWSVVIAMPALVPKIKTYRSRGAAQFFAGWALALMLAVVLGSWAAAPAAAQSSRPSPYNFSSHVARSYSTSAYRRSPYAPDYSYDSYRPRNYSGQVSNYEYTRQQLSVVAASAGLQPPSIYTPWYDGSYRVRYGLGYYGPYYPRYYYGYSRYYRPWYRWYRPWGGSPWLGWGLPLPAPVPGLPWGLGIAPGPLPFAGPQLGIAPEFAVPDCPLPGGIMIPPGAEAGVDLPPIEELPGGPLPNQGLPQQPEPAQPTPQNGPQNGGQNAAGQKSGPAARPLPQATPISAPAPARNYGGAYYW